ncbi:hypothetical protein [Streptomyces halobius]|uniref:Uncharacterized protein n=1 Tax=Streptomyces halobius TaxID=2879846 RepID=A0ABY4M8J5_9ACTN|nr:hypothetical protein [Streptomyces halobius]UQA93727.1 hypothetical protein K9S39_19315 [Streptomyces halobius]
MGEFVSVDPERVRKLANRLKDLEAALARHGPSIRKKFRDWESDLDVSLISKQTHAVGDDARDMAKRADLARNLEEHSEDVALCTPDGNLVNIPWDIKDVKAQSAKEAKQEAQTLKTALDDLQHIKLTPPGSRFKLIDPHAKDEARADIKAIAQSLLDHKDDPAYLAAFADAGGVREAARLGRVLHQQDGTHGGKVLSDDSTKLIGQYAQGVNGIFHLPKKGKNALSQASLKSLTHPSGGDMWSVGMLFKYGPSGDAWNPKVLSEVAGSMLDWRRKQKAMRLDYGKPFPPHSNGGYVGQGDAAWYDSLDFDLSGGPDDDAKTAAGIRANDPSLAVISRLGQNAEASRDLLGHNSATSNRYASDLIDFRWQTPGPKTLDDSDAPRRVLTLAATDLSPEHRDQSGLAAANILAAAAKEHSAFEGRNGHEKEAYEHYPKGTAAALAGITGTWASDLGGTGASATDGAPAYLEHSLVARNTDAIKAMQLFAKDNPRAAALFDTTLHQQVSDAVGSKHPRDQLTKLGAAAGLFTKAKVGISYKQAQQLDEDHQLKLDILNTAGAFFGFASGPKPGEGEVFTGAAKVAEKGFEWSQNLVLLGRTVAAPHQDPFSVDNADKQEDRNEDDAREQPKRFHPSIAQGMIRSGKIEAPTGKPWYNPETKTISVSPQNHREFDGWFNHNSEHRQPYLDSFQIGFLGPEGALDGK